MNHEPNIEPTVKMEGQVGWHGSCSCGWEGSGVLSESRARKAAQSHADDKMRAAVVHAETTTDRTPQEVVEAATALLSDHYDFASASWERATSAIVVYAGDDGSVAIRYIFNGDLTDVITTERVRRGKR